jgi:hypothetical protein
LDRIMPNLQLEGGEPPVVPSVPVAATGPEPPSVPEPRSVPAAASGPEPLSGPEPALVEREPVAAVDDAEPGA